MNVTVETTSVKSPPSMYSIAIKSSSSSKKACKMFFWSQRYKVYLLEVDQVGVVDSSHDFDFKKDQVHDFFTILQVYLLHGNFLFARPVLGKVNKPTAPSPSFLPWKIVTIFCILTELNLVIIFPRGFLNAETDQSFQNFVMITSTNFFWTLRAGRLAQC